MHVNSSIMDPDCSCIDSARMLSPFLVVDFTDDNIAFKSHKFHQNPRAQRFYHLRDLCLSENILFEDPDFPPGDQVLFEYPLSAASSVQWLRPSEIFTDPEFFVHDSVFEIQPGYQPYSRVHAAIVALATNKRAFDRTVPCDNCFDHGKYAGIFHFRFWQHGRWLDVVIDDRLPTLDKKLIFSRSNRANELWCCLLEKAYAKFRGSYNLLNCGMFKEIMQDFTGGITESVHFKIAQPSPESLYGFINTALKQGSMIAGMSLDEIRQNKARSCSIYPIIRTMTSGTQLIYFQNITEQTRDLHEERSIRFWMSVEQLMRNFDCVEMCHMTPDPLKETVDEMRHWNLTTMDGTWVTGLTAGGCRDYTDSYGMNPKLEFNLSRSDSGSELCSVVISLIQLQITSFYPCLVIGFAVYRIIEKDRITKPLIFSKYSQLQMIAESNYSNSREVICRLQLPFGKYLIIPTTKQPDENGHFFLRIFSQPRSQTPDSSYEIIAKHSAELLALSCDWDLLVRMFYDLANHWGLIERSDLAVLLLKYFSNSAQNAKRPKITSKPQSKLVSLMIEQHAVELSSIFFFDFAQYKAMVERINMMQHNFSSQLNFHQFSQLIAEDLKNLEETFHGNQ